MKLAYEPVTAGDLQNWFTHHPPKGDEDVRIYQENRNAGREMAETVAGECPSGRERDIAVEKIREAVFWANAAIACGQETE